MSAAATDLITIARAKQNIPSITDTSFDALLQTLTTAVSRAIEKYCRRDFYARAYDEVYNGNGQRRLLLRAWPVQSIESLRYRPVTVLKITNTDPANVQARVTVVSTGLKLVRVNAGTKTTVTSGLTFAGNLTLTLLAAAVNALSAAGWSAQVVGDSTNYGSWPSGDLYWPPVFGDGLAGQSGLSTVAGSGAGSFAELKMHTYELQGFQWDSRGWLLRAIPYTDPELQHPEDLVFPVGVNNLRVQYTAGYTAIPDDLQEAAAEWVVVLYWQTKRDPGLDSESVAQAFSKGYMLGKTTMPHHVRQLLTPYRWRGIGNLQS